MTKQQRQAIDGFVSRRPSRIDGIGEVRKVTSRPMVGQAARPIMSGGSVSVAPARRRSPIDTVSDSDLKASLRDIDGGTKQFGKRSKKTPLSRRAKVLRRFKWIAIILLVIGLIVGGWIAYRAMMASNNIFKGNILGLIQNKPLKEDANGRSNILLLGTSEDDPGHPGGYLTDSMMVVSLNQKQKVVDMFSIPRDLHVQYGMACASGYQGKINVYFSCVNEDMDSKEAEEQRLTETRKFVGQIFGLDIQYAVHVNNTVIKESVDAVGGIDVNIQGSNGDPGILDRNFDWRCNYRCHLVKYDNGVHHLDGERALFLSMARGDVAPTYGLGNSNFDREKNQQKIIIALKEKAVSTGTLGNVGKVTGLIDALGNNLRTNFETSEIRTLMDVGTKMKSEDIKTISLFDGEESVVTTGSYGGASVVMPKAGIFEYTQIQSFLKKKLSSNPVTREQANIVVLNGSGVPGVAQDEATALEAKGFIIEQVDNAPEGSYGTAEIYQIGAGKPATKAKLEAIYKVKAKTSKPPVTVTGDTNFVVIVGKARDTTSQ